MQKKSNSNANVGRPTKYNFDIANTIGEMIASSNKSMVTICKELGISYVTHLYWLREHEEYLRIYTRAKEDQADFLAEEMLEIADDGSKDTTQDDDGFEIVNHENIARARLRVDTRKFIAAKLKPKRYGDRVEQVITNGKSLPDWMNEGDE